MLNFPLKVASAPVYTPYKPKSTLFFRKLKEVPAKLEFEVLMDSIYGPVGYMWDRYLVKLEGKPADIFKNVKEGQMLRFFGRTNGAHKASRSSRTPPVLEVIFLKYGDGNFSETAKEEISKWSRESYTDSMNNSQ